MADRASFDFRFMLVNEGPLFLGVAFVADLASGGVGPQLSRAKRPMRVMAIIALD
jgi:hypothetical protein